MSAPAHAPPRTQSFSGCIPVFIDWDPNGPCGGMGGQGQWRGVRDFEHSTLCRAFGLDPIRFHFDVASSARGVGRISAGYGGNDGHRRNIDGEVYYCGERVGKLIVCRDDHRYRDTDPLNQRDFYDLSHWTR